MGFSEFINGLSAEQLARMRQWEEDQHLRGQHEHVEDLLAVLRPQGDNLPLPTTRFELWLRYGIQSRVLDSGAGGCWDWWSKKFPESWRLFGAPVHWDEPNLDFLASALGELPLGILYFPVDAQFYFRDYAFESAYSNYISS
jgi:hypothetical protein